MTLVLRSSADLRSPHTRSHHRAQQLRVTSGRPHTGSSTMTSPARPLQAFSPPTPILLVRSTVRKTYQKHAVVWQESHSRSYMTRWSSHRPSPHRGDPRTADLPARSRPALCAAPSSATATVDIIIVSTTAVGHSRAPLQAQGYTHAACHQSRATASANSPSSCPSTSAPTSPRPP